MTDTIRGGRDRRPWAHLTVVVAVALAGCSTPGDSGSSPAPAAEDGSVLSRMLARLRRPSAADLASSAAHAKAQAALEAARQAEAVRQYRASAPPPSPTREAAEATIAELSFVPVPAGRFTMGAKRRGSRASQPQHEVTITRSFEIARFEVTARQWWTLMGTIPSFFSACGERCPVENTTWSDAVAYANKLSELAGRETCYELTGCTGTPGLGAETDSEADRFVCQGVRFKGLQCGGYRLPTEAEWEYAFAVGSGSPPGGAGGPIETTQDDSLTGLDDSAWHTGNSTAEYPGAFECNYDESGDPKRRCGVHPVGARKPDQLGIHDLLGNVSEWVYDRAAPFDRSAQIDPLGPDAGDQRVARGCGWNCRAKDTSPTRRLLISGEEHTARIGFRLVRTLVP